MRRESHTDKAGETWRSDDTEPRASLSEFRLNSEFNGKTLKGFKDLT